MWLTRRFPRRRSATRGRVCDAAQRQTHLSSVELAVDE
jgi:hypothetical protein